ncbi:MAG: hypothetical protein WEC84_04025 [Candidatus Andersenbacteria bacterium]
MIPSMPLSHFPQLEHMQPLSWDEAFAIWHSNEAHNPSWQQLVRERGFDSWEEWRMTYATPLALPSRSWHLYRIHNPLQVVPTFQGGPFKTWIARYYGGISQPPFSKIVQHPQILANPSINSLFSSFPTKTTIMGLQQSEVITIIEGMHRCCALALAAQRNIHIETELYIALADATNETLPEIGQVTNV